MLAAWRAACASCPCGAGFRRGGGRLDLGLASRLLRRAQLSLRRGAPGGWHRDGGNRGRALVGPGRDARFQLFKPALHHLKLVPQLGDGRRLASRRLCRGRRHAEQQAEGHNQSRSTGMARGFMSSPHGFRLAIRGSSTEVQREELRSAYTPSSEARPLPYWWRPQTKLAEAPSPALPAMVPISASPRALVPVRHRAVIGAGGEREARGQQVSPQAVGQHGGGDQYRRSLDACWRLAEGDHCCEPHRDLPC